MQPSILWSISSLTTATGMHSNELYGCALEGNHTIPAEVQQEVYHWRYREDCKRQARSQDRIWGGAGSPKSGLCKPHPLKPPKNPILTHFLAKSEPYGKFWVVLLCLGFLCVRVNCNIYIL